MLDSLAIINKVIAEHHTIRGHIKLAGETVNDFEALASARRTYASWSQSSIQELADTQNKLQQAVSYLSEGLKNHFSLEEEALSPLLGELLTKALVLEHQGIRNELAEAKSKIVDTRLEGLSQPELLAAKSDIQQVMASLSHMIEEHASKEETILGMMKRALENMG